MTDDTPVGGKDWKQHPQTSIEAILKPNAADPKDSGFLRKGDRAEGMGKFIAEPGSDKLPCLIEFSI